MTTLHLTDLDTAYAAVRAAVAADIRTYAPIMADTVFGDSRESLDERDAIGLMQRMSLPFTVVVLADDLTTDIDPDNYLIRTRRYEIALVIVQPYLDGNGEDDFLTRVELIENRIGARTSFDVDVDGTVVEFRLAGLDRILPIGLEPNENFEIVAHRTVRRVTLEVEACAY